VFRLERAPKDKVSLQFRKKKSVSNQLLTLRNNTGYSDKTVSLTERLVDFFLPLCFLNWSENDTVSLKSILSALIAVIQG